MSFTPIIAGSGLGAWAYLERTQAQQKEIFRQAPVVDRAVQEFSERIGGIQTAGQLLDDYSVLKVALGAFGLDDDINNKAFIKQVLESDLDDPLSLANKLSDDRYRAMAETFGFNSASGPQLTSAGALQDFPTVGTPDDLLANRSLLKQALAKFGLEDQQNNQFFLQRVLESDLSDPASFVNKLSDPKLVEFAEYFDFAGRAPEHDNPIQALVAEFDKYGGSLASAEDLVEDEDLLQAVIGTFGLQRTSKTFIKDVLLSDPTDEGALVNTLEDKRYLAVSEAFGFGWPDVSSLTVDEFLGNARLREESLDAFNVSDKGDDYLRSVLTSDLSDPDSFVNQTENLPFYDLADAYQNGWPAQDSKMQAFSNAVYGKLDSMTAATDVVFDLDVFEATVNLFGMGDRKGDFVVMQKVLESDLDSGTSFANFRPDNRMETMARAFSFDNGDSSKRVYPEGFAEEIADRYISRQFEVSVGEVDPDMRLALSLERELTSIVSAGGGEDAHWYNIMGSAPMRQLFETAMQMPSGFGSLDIDQQLGLLKEKSESVFGTSNPADFLETAKMDEVRKRFLLMSGLGDFSTSGTSSSILSLLA